MATRKALHAGERGFTLVEVTIILLVLVIISMIMLPQLGNFNRLARKVKVAEDLGAICATMKKFLDEVLLPGPYGTPGGACTSTDAAVCTAAAAAAPLLPVGLLAGTGTPATDTLNPVAPGTGTWALATTATFVETPDMLLGGGAAVSTTFQVDSMDEHLQYNRTATANLVAANRYRNQKDDPTVGAFLGWRGPYFDMVTPDPWGGRYLVNTFGLHRDSAGNAFSTAVICYSAGPNINAETLFNQPHPVAFAAGGDDIAVVLSAFGPF